MAFAVAMVGIALIAEKADAAARTDQPRQFIEFLARLRGGEMRLIDTKEGVELSGARREPPFLQRSEVPHVQIADAALVERGGELALGKARAARGRDRPHIDKESDLGTRKLVQDGADGRLLVADGERGRQFLRERALSVANMHHRNGITRPTASSSRNC